MVSKCSRMETPAGIKKNAIFFSKKSALSRMCSSRSHPNRRQRNSNTILTTLAGTGIGISMDIPSPKRQIPNTIAICISSFIYIHSLRLGESSPFSCMRPTSLASQLLFSDGIEAAGKKTGCCSRFFLGLFRLEPETFCQTDYSMKRGFAIAVIYTKMNGSAKAVLFCQTKDFCLLDQLGVYIGADPDPILGILLR